MSQKISLLALGLCWIISQSAHALTIQSQEKIYFANMKLQSVVPVTFAHFDKTFYFLRFSRQAPSDRKNPLLQSDIVVPEPEGGCVNFYFVHEENVSIPLNAWQKEIGQISERAVPVGENNCDELVPLYAPSVDDPAAKLGQTPLHRANFPYTWSLATAPSLPVASWLKNIQTVFDFFGAKGEHGFLKKGNNAYTSALVKALGELPDRQAFDFALQKQLLNQAWLQNSSWDHLPQIDDYLVSLYPDKLTFYDIIEHLWQIRPAKTRAFVEAALTQKPELKPSTLSVLVDRLPYPEFIELALTQYAALDEDDKISFLSYTFSVPRGHDEILQTFLTTELENVKTHYTKFDDYNTRAKMEKLLSDYLAFFERRKKENLYNTKSLVVFLREHRYETDSLNTVRGMRFREHGVIHSGSIVAVPKDGETLYFRLKLTPELNKKLYALKNGDPIAFEGTLENFGLYSNETKDVSIELDNVWLEP